MCISFIQVSSKFNIAKNRLFQAVLKMKQIYDQESDFTLSSFLTLPVSLLAITCSCLCSKHVVSVVMCAHVDDSSRLIEVPAGAVRQCRGWEHWPVAWKIYWTVWTRRPDKHWRTQMSQNLPVQGLAAPAAASIYRTRGQRQHAPLPSLLHPLTPHLVASVRLRLSHRQPCISEPRFVRDYTSCIM